MSTEVRCELLPAQKTRTAHERMEQLMRWSAMAAQQAQDAPSRALAEERIDEAYQLHLVAEGLRLEERS